MEMKPCPVLAFFEWFKRFKGDRTIVESDEREGRPSTSRNEKMIQQIRTAIRVNHHLTIIIMSSKFHLDQLKLY